MQILLENTEDVEDLQEEEEIRKFPIGKIFAFFSGLMILVFIALVMYNLNGALGGTNILNGNLHPLFNYQTVLEDSNWGNIKTRNNDYQNNLPLNGKNSITGIDDIVAVAETGHCEDKAHVEKGSITFTLYKPSEFKMCYYEGDVIEDFYLNATVVGGYTPYELGVDYTQEVEIYQKYGSQMKNAGGIGLIDWVFDRHVPCKTDYWTSVITAKTDFSLESDQYPTIIKPWCCDTWSHDGSGYIPGKKVDFDFTLDWCGCDCFETQGFTILPQRDTDQFP